MCHHAWFNFLFSNYTWLLTKTLEARINAQVVNTIKDGSSHLCNIGETFAQRWKQSEQRTFYQEVPWAVKDKRGICLEIKKKTQFQQCADMGSNYNQKSVASFRVVASVTVEGWLSSHLRHMYISPSHALSFLGCRYYNPDQILNSGRIKHQQNLAAIF